MIHFHPGCDSGKHIDGLIDLYRSRLYLKGSEYGILSDIGNDAEKMLTFLESQKEALIDAFNRERADIPPSKIRGFALYHARYADTIRPDNPKAPSFSAVYRFKIG